MSYRLPRSFWPGAFVRFSTEVRTRLHLFLPRRTKIRITIASTMPETAARRDRHRARPGDGGIVLIFIVKLITMMEENSCRFIAGATTP